MYRQLASRPLVGMATGLLALAGAWSAACVAADPTLYERLGGEPVVRVVTAEVIDEAASRHDLGRSFQDTDLARIKRLFAEQVCALTGGGCVYSGDPMREVHAGHAISQAEFYGMVQLLRDALGRHGVALRERNELLALLAPMERDIVEPPKRRPAGAR